MLKYLDKSCGILALSALIAVMAVTQAVRAQAINAPGPQVVDQKGNVIGTLISTNTVLISGDKKYFAVKFKMPGFDVFTEIDQGVVPTIYYESADCSGPMYYSDQADGRWKRNLSPSVYDIPSTGLAVGVTRSDVDKEFYSRIDLYYPDGSPGKVTVRSNRIIGEDLRPSDCISMNPASDQFWTMNKITLEAQPPFRLK